MKKVILSIIMLLGLSFNVQAGPTAAGYAFQPWAVPVVALIAAAQVEYKTCNDLPYRTVSRKGTNFYFDVNECDYQKYKNNYK